MTPLHDDITTVALIFAGISLLAAIAAMIVGWFSADRATATSAIAVANNLAQKPGLVPSAGDISKVLNSAKALIDSLSKASPMIAWLAASVFFLMVAAFNKLDMSHKPDSAPHCVVSATNKCPK